MRIDDVNAAVQELGHEDALVALERRDTLFQLLLKRDKFYAIGALPKVTMAPIQGSDQPYLRVFTHQELAAKAAKTGEVTKINSLELCRLAKYWFLRGVPGLVVNDGAAWFAISLATVLTLFAHLVLAPAPRQEDVEVVKLYYGLLATEGRPVYRKDVYAYAGEASEGWEPGSLEQLKERLDAGAKAITTPDGFRIPAARVKTILTHLDTLTPDDPYDVQDLDLFPEPRPESVEEQPKAVKPKWKRPGWKLPKWKLPDWKLPPGIALIAIVAILLLTTLFARSDGINSFKRSLIERDYQAAQTWYEDTSVANQDRANEALQEHIRALTEDYADDKLSQADLEKYLAALRNFPDVRSDVLTGAEVAAELAVSKDAYQAGVAADTVSDRLHAWRSVLEADTGSYRSVSETVRDREKEYTKDVLSEIQRYRDSGLMGHAYLLAQDLLYWYPHNTDVRRAAEELERYKDEPDMALPVDISQVVFTRPTSDGIVNLYIHWRNCSSKTIREVSFYVVPLDGDGNPLRNPYQAIDASGYDPGDGPESDTWGWANAWRGANIASAAVTQVDVTFADGIEQSFLL